MSLKKMKVVKLGEGNGVVFHHLKKSIFHEWAQMPDLSEILTKGMKKAGVAEGTKLIKREGGTSKDFYLKVWMHPIADEQFQHWLLRNTLKGGVRPGCVYAAIYDNGLTKVGLSSGDASDRLETHDRAMSLTDAKPIRHITVKTTLPLRRAEKLVIKEMGDRFESKTTEWFVCSDVQVVSDILHDLP